MDNAQVLAKIYHKKAQEIVLQLIESTVKENELQHLCCFITPGQFEDVCLERCIAGICGYPLCTRPYSDKYGSRQYIIRSKAVYDISRRRNFCSNVCFEASLRLLSQIPSSPLYMRGQGENERVSIVLPDVSQLKGLYGDKVNINNSKPLSDADTERTQKSNTKNHHSDLQQPCNNTAHSHGNRRRKNKLEKLPSEKNELQEQKIVKSNESKFGMGNNHTEDMKGLPETANSNDSLLSHHTIVDELQHCSDVPTTSSAAALTAFAATTVSSCLDDVPAAAVAQVEDHLRQWLKWPSFLLLLGEAKLYERCGLTPPSSPGDEDSTFANRVRRLHAGTLAKVEAFYKGSDSYAETPEDQLTESGLPLIDQHNIISWRRNIFLQKLEFCERSLVARLRLPREEVRQKLKAVALTLHLTQHNLYLRPAQWALVTLVLFKLISGSCEEVREAFTDDTALRAEVLPRLAVLGMELRDLDALVSRLLTPPVLRHAHIEYQKLHAVSPCRTPCDDETSPTASEVTGPHMLDETSDQSEVVLPNIAGLSITKEENNHSLVHMSHQCIYSQTDALD